MLLPNPTQHAARIVLIARQPQFSLLRYNVKDLALDVGQIRVPTLFARLIDVELEERGADEEDDWFAGRRWGVTVGVGVAAGSAG